MVNCDLNSIINADYFKGSVIMKSSYYLDLFKKYFLFFIFYAALGWCYETVLEVLIYREGFSKRGFLFGPYLPVYGFGALAFIICLRKLKDKKIKIARINVTPLLVFLGIMVTATSIEFVTSYVLEIITGSWLWDYKSCSFNFQGRIALNPSARFGIGGMGFIYICQPLLDKIMRSADAKKLTIIFKIIFLIFAIDFLVKNGSMLL